MRLSFLQRMTHLRRTLRALERLATGIEQQNLLLTRIADHLAPVIDPQPADRVTTGPSFSRDEEQVLIQDYVEKVKRDTGHDPTDEEIEEHLMELGV